MPQSTIKRFVGAILALAIVASCTALGALTTWAIYSTLAWMLWSVSSPPWLNGLLIGLFFSGGPIGFVIGVVWAKGVLRLD